MAKHETSIMDKVGVWAFIIGLLLTLIIALIKPAALSSKGIVALISILGLVVGLINVADAEVNLYLLATITLLLSANSLIGVMNFLSITNVFTTFLQGVIIFVAPGAVIVSLRALYDVAKSK
ncbi:MAG: hypothetical protein ACOYT4_05170 [Nanoarchaeota archaeon]